jgi:hypothetical protein
MSAKRDKAAKVFEIFIGGTTDGEIEAAYDRLCALHVTLRDVADHISGDTWETKNAHVRFELTDDIAALAHG